MCIINAYRGCGHRLLRFGLRCPAFCSRSSTGLYHPPVVIDGAEYRCTEKSYEGRCDRCIKRGTSVPIVSRAYIPYRALLSVPPVYELEAPDESTYYEIHPSTGDGVGANGNVPQGSMLVLAAPNAADFDKYHPSTGDGVGDNESVLRGPIHELAAPDAAARHHNHPSTGDGVSGNESMPKGPIHELAAPDAAARHHNPPSTGDGVGATNRVPTSPVHERAAPNTAPAQENRLPTHVDGSAEQRVAIPRPGQQEGTWARSILQPNSPYPPLHPKELHKRRSARMLAAHQDHTLAPILEAIEPVSPGEHQRQAQDQHPIHPTIHAGSAASASQLGLPAPAARGPVVEEVYIQGGWYQRFQEI
ncbi:MAG: hypothetical protein M1826_002138 [Phylliscum demangeonii]|nr:MAG: hypothetical protein M1826_002138 [Phylliscum demangeonii]